VIAFKPGATRKRRGTLPFRRPLRRCQRAPSAGERLQCAEISRDDQPRSAEVSRDQPRSAEISRDQPRLASTSVDFPTPLEPRMAILAPASTASVTSLSTAPRPGRPMLASSSRSRGAPPDSGVPARNSKASVRSKARRACTRAVASEALSLVRGYRER